jgi:hypothetical protein
MNKEIITEGNKLIAEFMGVLTKESSGVLLVSNDNGLSWYGKLWDKDWSMLMPVVDKIETGLEWAYTVDVTHCLYGGNNYTCAVYDAGDATYIEVEHDEKITAVWLVVIDFIKWRKGHKTTV